MGSLYTFFGEPAEKYGGLWKYKPIWMFSLARERSWKYNTDLQK
jgi:hypothetical protein